MLGWIGKEAKSKNRLAKEGSGVTTLEQVATTVDHLTSQNGIPRGNHSKSSLVYLEYHGRPRVSIGVYRRTIAMVTLSNKYGSQR